ncbi:unnamed protein product [Anisakis simplex]|uniref:phosphoethanolamine N-methyltransferase n=1 Tax=Anisakis simplex TaxID=6269 RepID=A0A0M3J7Q1_ANISI|nr:unnamed protein product [Anisakis simplex]
MELLEEKKANCTLIENGLKGLCESASRGMNVFDAVIISKLIIEDHLIDKPSELDSLAKSILKVLKNDGVAIIREDLDGYRATEKVCQFTSFFDLFSDRLDDSTCDVAGFDFYSLKQLNATIHTTRNFFDFLWVLKKKQHSEHVANGSNEEKAKTEKKTFRDFLDTTQYTDEGIRAYEWVFGNHFISPGGYEENLKVLKRFGELKVGSKMLDIGVGIGGGARQAAKEFGLLVHGIDISANMLATGMDRLQEDKDTRIRYQICDALNYKFPSNHFDYVFSRDCLHHVEHMRIIFSNILVRFTFFVELHAFSSLFFNCFLLISVPAILNARRYCGR